MSSEQFIKFSKPFLDALKDTFTMMVQTDITTHSPRLKKETVAHGDITAIIGMSGTLEKEGDTKDFKGLMAISWPEDVYIKIASAMLFEEYTEYCDEIADSGAEICNIVMGNAKKGLVPMGFKLGLATPSTIRGKNHEIKYPANTSIIEIQVSSGHGDFVIELCYQEY